MPKGKAAQAARKITRAYHGTKVAKGMVKAQQKTQLTLSQVKTWLKDNPKAAAAMGIVRVEKKMRKKLKATPKTIAKKK